MSRRSDILRGGLSTVVFYTGAGDRLVVDRLAETDPMRDEVEHYRAGDGTKRVRTREREWTPQLVSASDVATLQRWQGEGKRVGCIGLGPTALLWRELVPILLEEAGGTRGDFAGKRLRMYTGLLNAEVERSSDLLAGVNGQAAEGVLGQRWRAALPLGGRLLRINADSNATLRIFDASGASVLVVPVYGSGYVTLPQGTHTIEIDAEGRRPRVYLDADNFALTLREADGGGYQLRAYGDGRFVLAERVTRTDRSGTTRTLGWRYRLLPEGQGRRRIRRDPETGTTSITHDT